MVAVPFISALHAYGTSINRPSICDSSRNGCASSKNCRLRKPKRRCSKPSRKNGCANSSSSRCNSSNSSSSTLPHSSSSFHSRPRSARTIPLRPSLTHHHFRASPRPCRPRRRYRLSPSRQRTRRTRPTRICHRRYRLHRFHPRRLHPAQVGRRGRIRSMRTWRTCSQRQETTGWTRSGTSANFGALSIRALFAFLDVIVAEVFGAFRWLLFRSHEAQGCPSIASGIVPHLLRVLTSMARD